MHPFYEQKENHLEIFQIKSGHFPPHFHNLLECVYVEEGTLAIGIGQELYHMNENDFAIVSPELIHHYQAFDKKPGKVIYLLASPTLCGSFTQTLRRLCPQCPVINADKLHPDIPYVLHRLLEEPEPVLLSVRFF
ncbi:MAG: cupin domain-containing protein [Lachnospiraceae bacterium]|nr:cupin domain-containing protein [Lachnospiraceae bacterium]